MHQYITDTKHCSQALIKLIFEEKILYDDLSSKQNILKAKSAHFLKKYLSQEDDEDSNDKQIMGSFHIMAESKQSAEQLQIQIDTIEDSLNIKQFSIQSLSGALLQVAKQGISYVHGNKVEDCPHDGKNVGTLEVLKNVIWQSRNQSLHFEEGAFSKSVQECFNNIETNFGETFSSSNISTKNMAYEIVELLDWTTYEK